MNLLFFVKYTFSTSQFLHPQVSTYFPRQQKLTSKVLGFRNNLYLRMLLSDTCFLFPSVRDFPILSNMLGFATIKFLHIVFHLYFLYS